MTQEEFKKLEVGDYIHDLKDGDEWEILGHNAEQIDCICTKSGYTWEEGQRTQWLYGTHSCFTIGRHPDNLPKEPEAEGLLKF